MSPLILTPCGFIFRRGLQTCTSITFGCGWSQSGRARPRAIQQSSIGDPHQGSL